MFRCYVIELDDERYGLSLVTGKDLWLVI